MAENQPGQSSESKPVFGSPVSRRVESRSKKGGERLFPKETQLVLDPEDYNAQHVKPELAKRPPKPGSERDQKLHEDIKRVGFSRFSPPNPLERRTR